MTPCLAGESIEVVLESQCGTGSGEEGQLDDSPRERS
jgi:hypothetical protein